MSSWSESILERKVSTKTSKRVRTKKQSRFIKGPIPLRWIASASNLPGKTLQVGLCLWFLVGLKKSTTIRMPSSVCRHTFGVSRQAMYRALDRLEQAGLILLERRKGKAFIVTVLDAQEDADDVGDERGQQPK